MHVCSYLRQVSDAFKPNSLKESRSRGDPLLTAREQEIVQLLAEGLTNKQIAVRLNIAVRTAETHRANIRRKLNLSTLSSIIRYAIRHRIIKP